MCRELWRTCSIPVVPGTLVKRWLAMFDLVMPLDGGFRGHRYAPLKRKHTTRYVKIYYRYIGMKQETIILEREHSNFPICTACRFFFSRNIKLTAAVQKVMTTNLNQSAEILTLVFHNNNLLFSESSPPLCCQQNKQLSKKIRKLLSKLAHRNQK